MRTQAAANWVGRFSSAFYNLKSGSHSSVFVYTAKENAGRFYLERIHLKMHVEVETFEVAPFQKRADSNVEGGKKKQRLKQHRIEKRHLPSLSPSFLEVLV